MASPTNKETEPLTNKPLQLDAASGGGAGAPGINGSNGGDGGGSEGGGAGGDTVVYPGTKGTPQKGGDGGGTGGQGGKTGATYMQGGTIGADISGANGGDANTGGSYGGGGGGGGAGVIASQTLTINNATIAGGNGGQSRSGPFGTGGNGGGGAGMVFSAPGPANILASATIKGGNGAPSSGTNRGADGGGGVGVYFDGAKGSETTNILNNAGTLSGGNSAGGGGGVGLAMSDNTTVNNNGGTILGGSSNIAADGGKGAGGPGILVIGANVTVNHTVAGGLIEGGESSDGDKTPPGIRVNGNAVTISTASQISGGTDLTTKSPGNAIEMAGRDGALELCRGYGFSGNVVCSDAAGTIALGGTTDLTSFDLSTIGAIGSGVLFQGFTYCDKWRTSTWTATGVANGIDAYRLLQGVLKLVGSGNLGRANSVTVGEKPNISCILDLSGIAIRSATLQQLTIIQNSQVLIGDKILVLTGDNGSLQGAISGTGSVTIAAGADYTLPSTGSILAPVVVDVQGSLSIDGGTVGGGVSIAGELVIQNEATFGGNVTVSAKGTVSPRESLEEDTAVTIKGNLTFQDSSCHLAYEFHDSEVVGDTATVLEVSGEVNLNGVTVDIANLVFTGETHILIQASDGINGTPTPGDIPSGVTLKVAGNQLIVSGQ
jgi:fibronectin-binding autotransporter adhesin